MNTIWNYGRKTRYKTENSGNSSYHVSIPLFFFLLFQICYSRIFLNISTDPVGSVSRPFTSPDLTLLDFYMWSYVKGYMYQTLGTYLQELNQLITSSIQPKTLQIHLNRHNEIPKYPLDILTVTNPLYIQMYLYLLYVNKDILILYIIGFLHNFVLCFFNSWTPCINIFLFEFTWQGRKKSCWQWLVSIAY